jgi:hypothetical protein
MEARRRPPLTVALTGRALVARVLVATAAAALALGSVVPGVAAASGTWTKNLYASSAFLYQDPYYTACTAADTMIMLNTIALRGTGGPGFIWRTSRTKNDPNDPRDLTSILAWERNNDTLEPGGDGSDAHGWRNALNYFGWGAGAMTDAARMMYTDQAYTSFDDAVHAAVVAIARFNKPVGVLAWSGGHAQVLTGYVATGEDPRRSDAFAVTSVYLSDPLKADGIRNRKLSLSSFASGDLHYRFRWYTYTDSPFDDPYTPGTLQSSVSPTVGPSEWYHRWVIVAPIRSQLPAAEAAPAPSPTRRPISIRRP